MSKETIQKLIAKGEGLAIEFKRCSIRSSISTQKSSSMTERP